MQLGPPGRPVAQRRMRRRPISGQALREAARFFRAGHIVRAIREAVRTMPAYTFTAEGSRAHSSFARFDEPVALVEGEDGQQMLQALRWQIRPAGAARTPDSGPTRGAVPAPWAGGSAETVGPPHGRAAAAVADGAGRRVVTGHVVIGTFPWCGWLIARRWCRRAPPRGRDDRRQESCCCRWQPVPIPKRRVC
jgi:hypothetical protein